jgi:hypothetical protein
VPTSTTPIGFISNIEFPSKLRRRPAPAGRCTRAWCCHAAAPSPCPYVTVALHGCCFLPELTVSALADLAGPMARMGNAAPMPARVGRTDPGRRMPSRAESEQQRRCGADGSGRAAERTLELQS